jgi:hypothetical protein
MLLLQAVFLELVEAIDGPNLDRRNGYLKGPLVEIEEPHRKL